MSEGGSGNDVHIIYYEVHDNSSNHFHPRSSSLREGVGAERTLCFILPVPMLGPPTMTSYIYIYHTYAYRTTYVPYMNEWMFGSANSSSYKLKFLPKVTFKFIFSTEPI